jgi:hypothetical protein
MAVPFGGHPTLGGARVFISVDRNGRSHEVLRIAKDDCCVNIVDPDPAERLAPSTVAYLQRRLGIKTPFAAAPEPPKPDAPTTE